MKINLIFITLFFLFSCSKEENSENKNLPLTTENIKGTWYLKQVVKADGTIVNYNHVCSTKKDYLEVDAFTVFRYYKYYSNCTDTELVYGPDTYITTTNIVNSGSEFDGVVTKLTKTELEISYGETRSVANFPQNFYDCKGIILSK